MVFSRQAISGEADFDDGSDRAAAAQARVGRESDDVRFESDSRANV